MEGASAMEPTQGQATRLAPCPRCEALNPRGAAACAACGLSLARQALADRYTQAPWQTALLSLLTFSLYDLYWFNRTWRMVRDLGGGSRLPARPLLLTLGLLVPLLNVYLVYRLFAVLRDLQLAATPPAAGAVPAPSEPPEPAALTVLYAGLLMCWLLPTPWWLATRLAVLPLAFAQSQVNRHVAAALPDVQGARQMSWLELGVLAAGLFFTLLLLNSTFGVA
jgi:hypothetical protein